MRHREGTLEREPRHSDSEYWEMVEVFHVCREAHGTGDRNCGVLEGFFPLRFFKTGFLCVVLAVLELVL